MTEGSVMVDDGFSPSAGVEDDSSQEEELETSEDTGDEGMGGRSEEELEADDQEEEGEKPKLTAKGTKLDPDPLSAAHQELANERAKIRQYEQVLGDPEALKRYAAQSGLTLTEAKAEIKEEKKEAEKRFTADNFKTREDVANVLNELSEKHEKALSELREENQKLKGNLTGLSEGRRVEQIAAKMNDDISTIRKTYAELNPDSPDYDPDLEKEIGDFYHELDAVDPTDPTKGYQGKHSLAKVTERIMRAAGKAKKKGSEQAQTEVRVKQAGKVVTSGKGAATSSTESKDPGTAIAQKIARALGNS